MKERYIYIHLRADNGECFYVGKGTKNVKTKKSHTTYFRSYCHHGRNPDWHHIVKTIGFTSKVVQEGLFSDEDASKAEQAWVAQMWDWGHLINRTRGGCGTSGCTMPRESVERVAAWRRGRTGDRCPNSQELFVYDAMTGNFIIRFSSHVEAGKMLPINLISIANAFKRPNHHARGYLFYHEDRGPKVPAFTETTYYRPRKVKQVDIEGNVLSYHDTIADASSATGISTASISRCCGGKQSRTNQGCSWHFVD